MNTLASNCMKMLRAMISRPVYHGLQHEKSYLYPANTLNQLFIYIKYFVNQCHQYYEKIYANNFILRKVTKNNNSYSRILSKIILGN